MQLFRDVFLYNDIFDLGFVGPPFTWQSGGVKSRLDHAVASRSWSDIFTHARVLHLSPIHGDHVLFFLGVFLSPFIPRRRSFRFRFESFWLQHDACEGAVFEGWRESLQGGPMFQVVKKITVTRLTLLHWQRNTFGLRGN